MKEVLQNIKIIRGKSVVNLEWQNFLKENQTEIQKFLNNYSEDISAKIEYVHNIYDILKQKLEEDNLIQQNNIKMGLYMVKNSESFKGYFSIYIDIKKGEDTIVLEPFVSRQNPTHIRLELWNREINKNNWSKERDIFKIDFPDAEQVTDGQWKDCLFLEDIYFTNNISLEDIANKLFGIIKKLI